MPINKKLKLFIFNHGWVLSYRLNNLFEIDDDKKIILIVATTIYQNDSISNINKLMNKLLTLGAGGTASRVYEFVPRIIGIKKENFKLDLHMLNFMKYSTLELKLNEFIFYTNQRNVLKNLKSIHQFYNISTGYDKFFIAKIYIPMFIRDQFMTHTQLSKLNRSYRVSSQLNNQYWIPDLLVESLLDYLTFFVCNNRTPELVKKMDYPKLIWTRYDTQTRYGQMILAGWLNDMNGWNNFFLLRGCIPTEWKNWVQEQTKQVAQVIYKQYMCGK